MEDNQSVTEDHLYKTTIIMPEFLKNININIF